MKIALLGFGFCSSNKGCEALSYAFINMLNEFNIDDLEVYVYSYSTLGDFPNKYNNIKFVERKLKLKDPNYLFGLKGEFKAMDCIFDITYGDGFSDIYGKKWNIITNLLKEIAIKSKTQFILLPQTYGPYKSKLLKKWALHIIKNSDLAFARDSLSANEINAKLGEKVITATDLAFALPYDKNKYSFEDGKFKIGLNVSSLLWDGGHNIKLATDYKEYCRRIISKYAGLGNVRLYLIPHVIDEENYSSLENDSRICKILHSEFPDTILAPDFGDPIEAKSYISHMDVFIGARMHSTIGAISSGVATIPFSYSKKFEGLFGDLNYPYLISARNQNTDDSVTLTNRYIKDKQELDKAVVNSMKTIEVKLEVVKSKIKNYLVKQ